MSTSRITWKIEDWSGRHRASVYVDGHRVRKAFFDTYAEAEQWCIVQREELLREVREY